MEGMERLTKSEREMFAKNGWCIHYKYINKPLRYNYTCNNRPCPQNRLIGIKYRAYNRNKDWELSPNYALCLILSECYYCGGRDNNLNGIDRVINGIGYIEGNCVSCCYMCNSFKSFWSIREFYKMVESIVSGEYFEFNIDETKKYPLVTEELSKEKVIEHANKIMKYIIDRWNSS